MLDSSVATWYNVLMAYRDTDITRTTEAIAQAADADEAVTAVIRCYAREPRGLNMTNLRQALCEDLERDSSAPARVQGMRRAAIREIDRYFR